MTDYIGDDVLQENISNDKRYLEANKLFLEKSGADLDIKSYADIVRTGGFVLDAKSVS